MPFPTYRRAARRAPLKAYVRPRRTYAPKRRSLPSYRGKGAYTAPKSAAWGQAAGSALGSIAGFIPQTKAFAAPIAALASKLGGFLGNKLGTYMGWGDYSVNMNSLLVPEGNSPAQMHSDGKSIRICHREYIGDIISSSNVKEFSLQNFQVNPASSIAFPWLWNIAVNFQKYKLHGAIVEFKSSSGDALTTADTSLGTVLIASNYNCADDNFQNRTQMENTQYTSSAKPSVSFVHIIECDPHLQTQTSLYTAVDGIPHPGTSINEVNWVNVQVASLGMQGTNVNLGSLYITYDVELIQPINQSDSTVFRGDWFALSGASGDWISNVFPNNEANPENTLGGAIVSGDTYVFPFNIQSGLFRMTYYCGPETPSGALGLPAFTGLNCTLVNTMPTPNAGGNPTSSIAGQGGADCMMATFTFKITGSGAKISATAPGTFAAGISRGGLLIDQIDLDYA